MEDKLYSPVKVGEVLGTIGDGHQRDQVVEIALYLDAPIVMGLRVLGTFAQQLAANLEREVVLEEEAPVAPSAVQPDPERARLLALDVRNLDLPWRVSNCLTRAVQFPTATPQRVTALLSAGDKVTVERLLHCTARDLLEVWNFGKRALVQVRKVLAVHGLALRGEDPATWREQEGGAT